MPGTHGLLCEPETARCIASVPGAFVSVSIDGADPQTHEWLRGVEGSFEKACRAVRCLADAGLKPQIVMSLVRRNAAQIEPLVRLAERLGARSVKFNLIQPTARGARLHEDGTALSVEELIRLGNRVESELSLRTPLRLHFDFPPAFRTLHRLAQSTEACGILSILGVLSTGHYALCGIGTQIKELVFGSAGEDNVAEIWKAHPVLRKIRSGLPGRLGGICGRCLLKYRCLGACLAQNYYASGSLWAPYWFCRQAEEAGLFPPSRTAETGCGEQGQAIEEGGTRP